MRVTVQHKRKNPNALKMMLQKAEESALKQLLDVAESAVRIAAEYTPKWSGTATEGWTLTLQKVTSVSHSGLAGQMGGDYYPEPIFPGGISDAAAGELNKSVVDAAMRQIRLAAYSKVRAGKNVEIWLTNTAPHAAIWLNGDDRTANQILRTQNQDYYTYADIQAAVKAYRQRSGKQGRFY